VAAEEDFGKCWQRKRFQHRAIILEPPQKLQQTPHLTPTTCCSDQQKLPSTNTLTRASAKTTYATKNRRRKIETSKPMA
jgi:hypothetical protein